MTIEMIPKIVLKKYKYPFTFLQNNFFINRTSYFITLQFKPFIRLFWLSKKNGKYEEIFFWMSVKYYIVLVTRYASFWARIALFYTGSNTVIFFL